MIVDVKLNETDKVKRIIQPTEPLKEKVIQDFSKWISRANIGHYEDYRNILHTISLIEAWNVIEPIEPYYEYFLYVAK